MSPDALARSRPDGSGVGSESPERTSVSRSTTLRAVSRPPIMPFRVPLAESFPLAGRSPVGREGYLFIYLFIYGSVTDDRAVSSPMTGLSGPGPCGPVLSSVSWIGLSPNVFQPCHFDSAVDLLPLGAGLSRLAAGFQGDFLQCDAHAAFPHDGTVWFGDVFAVFVPLCEALVATADRAGLLEITQGATDRGL